MKNKRLKKQQQQYTPGKSKILEDIESLESTPVPVAKRQRRAIEDDLADEADEKQQFSEAVESASQGTDEFL